MEQHKKISIQDFLAGTECRFECVHRPIYYKCFYKINGKKHRAKICFESGEIVINGQVVRRCNLC